MTHPGFQIHHVMFIAHTDGPDTIVGGTFRVFTSGFHLIEQVWQGSQIIDQHYYGAYVDHADAVEEAESQRNKRGEIHFSWESDPDDTIENTWR